MKITNLKSVKADSIATVELSQVRVEMQLQILVLMFIQHPSRA
jgi:hypothetical protein